MSAYQAGITYNQADNIAVFTVFNISVCVQQYVWKPNKRNNGRKRTEQIELHDGERHNQIK